MTTATITFKRWQNYGKDRLYVEGLEGLHIGRCYVEEVGGAKRVRFCRDAQVAHRSMVSLWENDVYEAMEAVMRRDTLDFTYAELAAAVEGGAA